jgi:hypothetical protein
MAATATNQEIDATNPAPEQEGFWGGLSRAFGFAKDPSGTIVKTGLEQLQDAIREETKLQDNPLAQAVGGDYNGIPISNDFGLHALGIPTLNPDGSNYAQVLPHAVAELKKQLDLPANGEFTADIREKIENGILNDTSENPMWKKFGATIEEATTKVTTLTGAVEDLYEDGTIDPKAAAGVTNTPIYTLDENKAILTLGLEKFEGVVKAQAEATGLGLAEGQSFMGLEIEEGLGVRLSGLVPYDEAANDNQGNLPESSASAIAVIKKQLGMENPTGEYTPEIGQNILTAIEHSKDSANGVEDAAWRSIGESPSDAVAQITPLITAMDSYSTTPGSGYDAELAAATRPVPNFNETEQQLLNNTLLPILGPFIAMLGPDFANMINDLLGKEMGFKLTDLFGDALKIPKSDATDPSLSHDEQQMAYGQAGLKSFGDLGKVVGFIDETAKPLTNLPFIGDKAKEVADSVKDEVRKFVPDADAQPKATAEAGKKPDTTADDAVITGAGGENTIDGGAGNDTLGTNPANDIEPTTPTLAATAANENGNDDVQTPRLTGRIPGVGGDLDIIRASFVDDPALNTQLDEAFTSANKDQGMSGYPVFLGPELPDDQRAQLGLEGPNDFIVVSGGDHFVITPDAEPTHAGLTPFNYLSERGYGDNANAQALTGDFGDWKARSLDLITPQQVGSTLESGQLTSTFQVAQANVPTPTPRPEHKLNDNNVLPKGFSDKPGENLYETPCEGVYVHEESGNGCAVKPDGQREYYQEGGPIEMAKISGEYNTAALHENPALHSFKAEGVSMTGATGVSNAPERDMANNNDNDQQKYQAVGLG